MRMLRLVVVVGVSRHNDPEDTAEVIRTALEASRAVSCCAVAPMRDDETATMDETAGQMESILIEEMRATDADADA